MKNDIRRWFQVGILALCLAGCGSSSNTPVTTSGAGPTATTDQQIVDQARLENPDLATELVPDDHLNPLKGVVGSGTSNKGTPTTISVADLESDYETRFCSLNSKLGVTETTPQCVDNINFIKSQPETGFFDLNAKPILNNPLGVTGVFYTPVEYNTTVPLPTGNQTFHVSGGMLLPQGIDKTKLKGIIVYFHGTTFNKSAVGSDYQSSGETQLNAQVFASQGYIVIIPDYVGQGVDWNTVHPYVLYPTVSAQTAVDMLSAVQAPITAAYSLTGGDPPLKLFSAGYSEGGAYSLWFNTYVKSNPGRVDPLFYRLTHSVGMEGAYSVSNITDNYLFEDVAQAGSNPFNVQSQTLVNLVKPLLSADAFLSYGTYSNGGDLESLINLDFFNMKASLGIPQAACNVDGQQVTIPSAFARPNTTIATELLCAGLSKTGNSARYPGLVDFRTSSANSIDSLVSATLLSAGPLAKLTAVMQAADVNLANSDPAGVSIISLDQDSVVVPNNFDDLSSRYPDKIKTAVKIPHTQLLSVSSVSAALGKAYWIPIDHLQGPTFEYLYALNIFNGF